MVEAEGVPMAKTLTVVTAMLLFTAFSELVVAFFTCAVCGWTTMFRGWVVVVGWSWFGDANLLASQRSSEGDL